MRKGRDPRTFRARQGWVIAGLLLLAFTALAPFLWPATRALTERLAPLLALTFLLSAFGMWARMGSRAVVVAGVVTLALYGMTAWTRVAFSQHDLFLIAIVVGFLVYALAGFYLVFVLEEVVYDAHRLLHLRQPVWMIAPSVLAVGLAVGLPFKGLGALPSVWIAALASTVVLGSYWFVRAFNSIVGARSLQEVHLVVISALAAALLLDGVRALGGTGLRSSVVAYLALVGTWVYVSYTTLQRTQFLLRGKNAGPWLAILFSASFAILGHAHLQYQVGGSSALRSLLDLRAGYMVVGILVGIVFLVARAVWRLLAGLRDDARVAAGIRITAGRMARLTESLLRVEVGLGRILLAFFEQIDKALPGSKATHPVGWELDWEEGVLEPLREEGR